MVSIPQAPSTVIRFGAVQFGNDALNPAIRSLVDQANAPTIGHEPIHVLERGLAEIAETIRQSPTPPSAHQIDVLQQVITNIVERTVFGDLEPSTPRPVFGVPELDDYKAQPQLRSPRIDFQA